MRPRVLLILALASASPALAQATDPEGNAQILPVDDRKNWVIVFTALQSRSLPPEDGYIAFSVPLLLKDRVVRLKTHSFPPEEVIGYKKQVVQRELHTQYKNLANQRQQRDAALFAATADPKTAALIEDKLEATLERIHWLEDLDPEAIELAEEKPLEIKEGSGAGNLFDAPQYSAYQFAQEQGADLVVGGTATEVQGYILIDLWAYEPSREMAVFTFREAAQREQIYSSIDEALKDLIGIVLGREWSLVTIEVDPPNATTSIDGESLGEGRLQSMHVKPGTRQIMVTAPGYADSKRSVECAAGSEQSLSIRLEKEQRPNVSLSTTPPGADVYLDSVWQGRTPLSLEVPAVRSQIKLDLPGYYGLPFSLGPTSPANLSFALVPDLGSRKAAQRKARDGFYLAFGFFLISLPIPIVSYTYCQDFAHEYDRYARTDSPGALNAMNASIGFWYAYLGGTVLSVSLLAWMAYSLIYYMESADRTAG